MEKAFKKILVAYDNSIAAKSALQSALGVSRKFDSSITALIVADESNEGTRESLNFINSFSKEEGVEINIVQRKGSMPDEVLKLEKGGEYKLILQGSRGTSGWTGIFGGTNAFKVVSGSVCPVISVTEAASSPDLKNILLPLADSRSTRQKVPYAIEMAKAFGAAVHILGVSKGTNDETKKAVRSYMIQTERYLQERGITCTKREEFGVNVSKTCIRYGEELKAGLMLIMTETESAGIFSETYVQKLIKNSTIPVMSIHSKDTRLAGASGY